MGCTFKPATKTLTIRIKGSDTMQLLLKQLAQIYMKNHPNVSVYVEGGGTSDGVKALIDGKIDICSASRPLKSAETSQIAQKYRSVGVFSLIAKDALSIYLNGNNPVKNLTIEELKSIFTGRIRNWGKVGGYDQNITVYVRPPNSGTNLYFKEHILDNQDYLEKAITVPTTQQIVEAVLENVNGIGYGGIGYGKNIVHCHINNIAPSEENVRNDRYPISRYLYLYTIRKPFGQARNFIDWILSVEGQRVVESSGYISLWPVN